MKKQHLVIVAAVLVGVILAGRIRSLPLGDKLPSI